MGEYFFQFSEPGSYFMFEVENLPSSAEMNFATSSREPIY